MQNNKQAGGARPAVALAAADHENYIHVPRSNIASPRKKSNFAKQQQKRNLNQPKNITWWCQASSSGTSTAAQNNFNNLPTQNFQSAKAAKQLSVDINFGKDKTM